MASTKVKNQDKIGCSLRRPSKPIVSVIIPCYNYARYLPEAVASVIKQTFQNFEIIIVNDGSSDNTKEIAEQLIIRYPRCQINLISQPNSGSPAASRNAGIRVSCGRYILPLDADDRLDPTFLEKAVAILDANLFVGLVYSHIQHVGLQQDTYRCGEFRSETLAADNVIPYCALFRRDLWSSVGGYRTDVGYEDWNFWLDALEKGWRGQLLPEPLFIYRKHDAGRLHEDNAKRELLLAEIVDRHPQFYPEETRRQARMVLKTNRLNNSKSPGRGSILIVCSHFWPSIGGLETIIEQLSANLVLKGYEVSVATSAVPGRDADTYCGVKIISWDTSKLINGIPEWLSCIRREVESGRYATCILVQDPLGPIIWSLEDIVVPQQTRLFIQPIINADGFSRWKDNASFRDRLKKILLNTTATITMSKSGPDDAYMRSEGIKPAYIPNAVSIPKPTIDFRSRFGIPDSKFLILHVANLYWVKNHVGLLQTLGDLTSDKKLVMIGQPSGERTCAQHFHETLKKYPEVLYIPGLPPGEVSAAMEAADVIVLASHGEGSPVTILEAMAHGKPWLATPNCGAANDNAGGIVCKLEEFPDYLRILSNNIILRKSLGGTGSLHWKKCFTWPVVIEAWIDLIEGGELQQSFEMPAEIADKMAFIQKTLKLLVHSEKASASTDSGYVNIGMITYNRLDFTRQCIVALVCHTDFPYVLTVVDNASTDGTREYLLEQKRKGVIKNLVLLDENIGVAKASNLAWHLEPNAAYYLKLDNDIVIQKPGWLTDMIEVIDAVPQAGAVGYSFEPVSFRLTTVNGKRVRIKNGNIGGACILIPKRTEKLLGYWCEDYGLYSEEDADYGHRISLAGLQNVYMEDENIGLHLPAGRAARIDPISLAAKDGIEEKKHEKYRKAKDEQRRKNISTDGAFTKNLNAYKSGLQPLYTESLFFKAYENGEYRGNTSTAGEKKMKVGFLSAEPHSYACPHIRLKAPLYCLSAQGSIQLLRLGEVVNGRLNVNMENLKQSDIIIVQRQLAATIPYAQLAGHLNRDRQKIVYEIDDALINVPENHMIYKAYQAIAPFITEYIKHADLVTVSTECLKTDYLHFNENIVVIPNYLDLQLWGKRVTCDRAPLPVRILFSGTLTHAADLRIVEDPIKRVLTEFGDKVSFFFWGNTSKKLSRHPQVKVLAEFIPDYSEYAATLRKTSVDFAIIPLEDNAFNQSKSHIKWIEYSACKIPGIYSRVGEYCRSIDDGFTGILVPNNDEAWYQAIKRLIVDKPYRDSLVQNAFEKVMRHHTLKGNAYRWLHTYKTVCESSNKKKINYSISAVQKEIDKKIKFSILIITWNRAAMLDQCLQALLMNLSKREECEIIVGDNGSTDGTSEVITKYKIDKYIRKDTNFGLELYSELFDLAKGEYLIEIDDDVLDFPYGFEQRFAEYFNAFPDYGLLGLDVVQNGLTNGAKPDKSNYRDDLRGSLTIEEGLVVGCCLCIKREVFQKIGKFGGSKLSMASGEDGVLWKKIHSIGLRAGILKDIKCFNACGPHYSREYGYLQRDIEKYKQSGLIRFVDAYNAFTKEKIEPDPYQIKFSIIIPLFNQIEFTKRCVEAIYGNTPLGFYELILVDNGSTDGTREYLQSLGDKVKMIRNDRNLGFAKANNQGAKLACGYYLIFLNNDTEPQNGWLLPLLEVFESDPDVAAVGCKLIYSDHSIQHAGVMIVDDKRDGDPLQARNLHVGRPFNFPKANELSYMSAVSAACIMVRKSLFFRVGGFDETYWNGYEDVDLCFKLRQINCQIVYQPKSTVIHHESKSGPERFVKAQENIKRLHSKWIGKIKPDVIINQDGSVTNTDNNLIHPYYPPGLKQEKLSSKGSKAPADFVSIVILTLNQLSYTKKCIESIRKYTREAHEIIFVDNGSGDGTVKWLRMLVKQNSTYKLIENRKNLGFSQGCNQGITASRGEFVLLLNNDVVVTEDWLGGMLECLNHRPDIGIVGPMTNNISGPQKVPYVSYSSIDDLDEYSRAFRIKNRHRKIPNRRVVGFCMLFRRQLVYEIGLLDESFGSGNFEDDDFCLRASLAGYHNVIAGDVFIHHYGSRTFVGNKIDYGASLSGNRKTFTEKWSGKDIVQRFGKKLIIENATDRALEFFQNGDIEKVTAWMLEALKQAPDDRSLYFCLAEMLIDAKRYADALGILESLPQGTADARQFALIGYCKEGLCHEAEAEEYADRALALDGSMAQALNIKGVVAYKKGEKDYSESLFKRAIESVPSLGESYTNLGSLKWDTGEPTEALNLFERGFILSPTVADVATAYHAAVAGSGCFARAEPVFREARALHPNDKRIAFLLIAILIQQEKHDLAMHEIEQAMIQFGIDDGILSAGLDIRRKIGPLEIDRSKKNKATLSLCMIVKNEEAHLAKCLMSVKPMVNEIIVVDTGSTDLTQNIAAALGAKVFDYPWTNDFSEARNYSVSKAAGDWILVLDADEVVSHLDHGRLSKITKQRPAKRVAYSLVTRNYTNNPGSRGWMANEGRYAEEEAGKGWVPSSKVRLFVNDKRIQFVNPVHELVEPTLSKLGIQTKACDVPVHHYGRLDQDKLIAKGKEYYRLGIAKIEQTMGDYNALKELAIQASEIGEYDEAVKVWRKVIELQPNDAVAHMNLGFAFLMLRQYENAIEFSKTAMGIDPELREAILNYSAAEMIAGDVRTAISTLEHLLERHADYPPAMGRLAAAQIVSGRKEEGLRYIEKLNSKGFDCASALEEQARAFMAESKFEAAVLLLAAAVEKGIGNRSMNDLLAECRSKIDGTATICNPIDFPDSLQRRSIKLNENNAALCQE